MERKLYKIEVHGNVNDYIQGRISGMIDALCSSEQRFAHTCICEDDTPLWRRPRIIAWIFTVEATEEEYHKIKLTIEKSYPKLCTYYKHVG